jgi:hypothetical protein
MMGVFGIIQDAKTLNDDGCEGVLIGKGLTHFQEAKDFYS